MPGLINGVISTVCGAIIFFHDRKGRKNRLYALFCLSISIFSFSYVGWQLSQEAPMALLFCRGVFFGTILIPVLHYHHTLAMLQMETETRQRFLWVSYGLTGFFLIFNFTPIFLKAVEPISSFPFYPVPGPMFHGFMLMMGVFATMSLHLMWEYRAKSQSPLERNEMAWIVVATGLGYLGGATNFFLIYKIPIPPYLNPAVSIFPLVGALLFFRLGLMDIQFFIRNSTVHLLSSLFLGGIYSLLVFPFIGGGPVLFIIIPFALLAPLVYQPVYQFVRFAINRTTLGKIDRYLGGIKEQMGQIRETTYTYDDLANNIVSAMHHTFPVEMVAVYFVDPPTKRALLKAQVGMKNPLTQDLRYNRSALALAPENPLMTWLAHNKTNLFKEEIELGIRQGKPDDALKLALEQIGGEACSPFSLNKELRGLLVLGGKTNGLMFHKEDLNALTIFSRMGGEVMRYIMAMENEVDNAALYSHDMNNDTKSVVQTLQFLKSPLGKKLDVVIYDSLIQQTQDVATRLNQTFQFNQDRSVRLLKSIRGEYERKPLDVVKILNESIGKFILRARDENIYLEKDIPDEPVMVEGDEDDLIRVSDNLIGNAFRYTPPAGRIALGVEVLKDEVHVSITDSGKGIKESYQKKIWDQGWQAENDNRGAAGLGLTIAKQIVELHRGKIRVDSPGLGRGTTFTYIIPLLKSVKSNLNISANRRTGTE